MKKDSSISILIPAYHPNLELLEECLRSIRQQDYQVETIIGLQSDENITDIAKKYEVKVIKYEHPSVYKTRIDLLTEASGEYIWFIDCDDLVATKSIDYLEKIISLFPGSDLIVVNLLRFVNPGEIPAFVCSPFSYKAYDIEEIREMFYENEIGHGIVQKIFRKDLNVSFPDIDIFMAEDVVLSNTILNAAKGQIPYITNPLYLYRQNPESGQRVPSIKHLTDLTLAAKTIESQNGNATIALVQRLFDHWGSAMFEIIHAKGFTQDLFAYVKNDHNLYAFTNHITCRKSNRWVRPSLKTRLYSSLAKKISNGDFNGSKRLVRLFLILQWIKHR